MTNAAITLEHVSVELGGHKIIDDVSCQIDSGYLTAIMGPNGTGKTTLLHAILGLLPFTGNIRFNRQLSSRRPRIGYVPQNVDLDRGSPVTVGDFLAVGFAKRPLWMGIHRQIEAEIKKVLERVGVLVVYNLPLGKISGGELQRVLLAQALLGKPEILLLDEPTAAVDISGEALFCELLEEVHNDLKLTTILVTHDLSVVAAHAHNVLCLNHSLICAGPTKDMLTKENLMRVFSPHTELFLQQHNHTLPDNKGNHESSD
ncbi:ABC transporter [candidate division LCP-89 bacterium B3_LCP]|uniref:ABC transporter n=1 Tax=candidate division LCP-89 bacterium B3_LCP TaxID=2012998 RepID=A0A532UZG7_UNCL8|nr:MAG: ABC transporter [candidate division LCP-89 bacterium B3_LCP]